MRKIISFLTLLMICSNVLFAQTKTITGKIKDEKDGSPLAGVSVVVKGTSVGTTTGSDGSFTLNAPANAKILVISSLNFETKEVSVGKGTINVSLTSAEAASLKEVVVTVPYGTVKKSTFTGSAATVNASTIQKQQVTSVTRVLDGQVPGISSTNGGGAPGSGAAVVIRGFGSVAASSSPLYVLNGVPYDGSIEAISNDDIESVDVLKDAAATNLYGSRAANGVIMINTKKGKKGPATIQVNVRHGISTRGIPEYERVSIPEYYELNWEAFKNKEFYALGQTSQQAGINASNILTGANGLVYNSYNVPGNQLVDPITGKINPAASLLWNESWSDALFRDAARTNVNMSISGASDKTNYFISAGYLKEDGTAKFSGYERYNFRTDIGSQANDWLKVGLTFDGASETRNGLFAGGSATSNPFFYSRQMGPIYPVYQRNLSDGSIVLDAQGKPVFDFGTPDQMGTRPYASRSNLLGSLALDINRSKNLNGNVNSFAEVNFLKDFNFKTTIGLNYSIIDEMSHQNKDYGDGAGFGGTTSLTNIQQFSMTANQVLSWNKTIKKHNIRTLVGHENYKYRLNYFNAAKKGFAFGGLPALDNATDIFGLPSSYEDNHTIESFFGSVNYSFDNKYLISASLRSDGSSRFAPKVRWGQFYSLGLAWRIKQEKFMERLSWLDDLKLKVSYGESGNENIGTGSLYYQYIFYYFADGIGNYGVPSNVANPDLKWEGNRNLNYGVEFAMFKRRLTGSVEFFNRISNNLLFNVPLPASAGFTSIWQNIGESKNYGFEVQLGYYPVRAKNFDWKIDFNLTSYKNVITKLPPNQRENGIITGTKKLSEGRSIFDFYLKEFAGVDPTTGLALYYKNVLNSDGKPTGERILTSDINRADFYYVNATAIPDFSGGVTNSFRYRSFQLSILTTYSYGGYFYDANYQGIMQSAKPGIHMHKDLLNRWQKPGDITNVPRLQVDNNQDQGSSRFLFDASYFNIKNITLSYDFSSILSKKTFIKDAQFFVTLDNAFFFTVKSGSDPQQSLNGTTGPGYPLFRTLTFGTTIKL